MELQVGKFIRKQNQLEDNVDNIAEKCNIVVSSVCKALGINLNGSLPINTNYIDMNLQLAAAYSI